MAYQTNNNGSYKVHDESIHDDCFSVFSMSYRFLSSTVKNTNKKARKLSRLCPILVYTILSGKKQIHEQLWCQLLRLPNFASLVGLLQLNLGVTRDGLSL